MCKKIGEERDKLYDCFGKLDTHINNPFIRNIVKKSLKPSASFYLVTLQFFITILKQPILKYSFYLKTSWQTKDCPLFQ